MKFLRGLGRRKTAMVFLTVVVLGFGGYVLLAGAKNAKAAESTQLVPVDNILYIGVDTDDDGQADDYQITVSGILDTFRTDDGQVGIWLTGEVNELRPLP